MGKLDGKVAVITGGGRGQGRSHAVRLAQEGADVVVCDITEQVATVEFPTGQPGDLEETVALVEKQGRRCVAVEADVRSTADMQTLADTAMSEFGRIDFLLANAGILSLSDSTWELTDEQWDDMIDINLTGVFKACRAVVPHIRAGGNGGSIVITSSIAGIKGVAGCTHYTAAKHGIVGLMRTSGPRAGPGDDPGQHDPPDGRRLDHVDQRLLPEVDDRARRARQRHAVQPDAGRDAADGRRLGGRGLPLLRRLEVDHRVDRAVDAGFLLK